MSENRPTYINVGAVKESKNGNLYISINKDTKVIINGEDFSGKNLFLSNPQDKYKRRLEKGSMTEGEYETAIEKIPAYIRKEITAKVE